MVGYDDAESVALKTEWAMKQGFRGVFFWQIGRDLMPDDTNPLQEASRKKFGDDRGEGALRPSILRATPDYLGGQPHWSLRFFQESVGG